MKMTKRSNDKRRKVELTPGEYRLLNDLVRFEGYLGQLASEETIRTALSAGLVRSVGRNEIGRPLVRPLRKGENHQKRAADAARGETR
jgi:hypothetical protein